jgi:hypothetical protein
VLIGVVGDLPLRLLLLLGAFGAVVAYALGALLVSLLIHLHGLPARRRERRVREIQDHLRRLDFRGMATPVVQRLRYLGGHGDPPADEPLEPWQGVDAEVEGVEKWLLQPTREALEAAGQGHLCAQIAIADDSLDPSTLAQEIDRLLGVVEGWQNVDASSSPFRFGRQARS